MRAPISFSSRFLTVFIAVVLAFASLTQAADASSTGAGVKTDESKKTIRELFKDLDYPELQVVPRASRRLFLEKEEESRNWWYIHWPIQASALATLYIGFQSDDYAQSDLDAQELDDFDLAKTGTRIIGVSWLLGPTLLGLTKPYSKAFRRVREVKPKGKQGQLLRERLAEEGLERAATLMKTLRLASAATNMGAAIYLGTFLNDTGVLFTLTSGLLAWLPYFFEDRHIYNYRKHLEYKRNIYAPITHMQLQPVKTAKGVQFHPSISMAWQF